MVERLDVVSVLMGVEVWGWGGETMTWDGVWADFAVRTAVTGCSSSGRSCSCSSRGVLVVCRRGRSVMWRPQANVRSSGECE